MIQSVSPDFSDKYAYFSGITIYNSSFWSQEDMANLHKSCTSQSGQEKIGDSFIKEQNETQRTNQTQRNKWAVTVRSIYHV